MDGRLPFGMRQSRSYQQAVAAANDFGTQRLAEQVKDDIASARLYVYALRSLDVYGPTQRKVEDVMGMELPKDTRERVALALKGLHLLSDARYHPLYRDHRIFLSLRQYHESLSLVEDALIAVRSDSAEMGRARADFVSAIESVTQGNGILVQNWRRIPEGTTTNYAKVNLDISRLVAGEFVGVYKVTVRADGRVPHHSHTYLDEHHFLPDAIDGIHQLGDKAARCTQSDIVYISHGRVHAFRSDETEDRAFLFICGSRVTGPWDFVQDITTYPSLDFPDRTSSGVQDIGGRDLGDTLAAFSDKKRDKNSTVRLTPDDIALFHDMVGVEDELVPTASRSDLEYYVASGEGRIVLNGDSVRIAKDDVFVIPTQMNMRILNDSGLTLYQFGRSD